MKKTYHERIKSFDHQLKARRLSWKKEAFGYLMEQGTGKSKTIADDAFSHYQFGFIDGLVITAPNGVCPEWLLKHIPSHAPEDLQYRIWNFQPKAGKKQAAIRDGVMDPSYEGMRIFIINYESLTGEKKEGAPLLKQFLKSGRMMWALDESHRIKTWEKSITTKTIQDLSPLAVMRRIATGTPIAQGPLDAYSQMFFLDPDILGYSSYVAFKCHFAEIEQDDSRTMWIIKQRLTQKYGKQRAERMLPKVVARDEEGRPRYKNLGELASLMAPHTYRVLKEDCLDLPPKSYQRRYVTMTPEQRRVYEDIRTEYMTEYDGEFLSAELALTRLTRLQQITGGFFPTDDGSIRPIGKTNPKVEELLSIAEDYEGKIIVWARFTAELDLITAALEQGYGKGSVARYWGAIPKKVREEEKTAFYDRENTLCRFFVSQPQSGGTGLDGLQVANTAVYYSNDFALLNRLQSEDRGHRSGLIGNMNIIDLETLDSRDGFIIDSLRGKKDVADIITGDPTKVWI